MKGDFFYYYIGPLEPVIVRLVSRAGSLLGTVIMSKCKREKTRDVQIGFLSFAQPTGSTVRTERASMGKRAVVSHVWLTLKRSRISGDMLFDGCQRFHPRAIGPSGRGLIDGLTGDGQDQEDHRHSGSELSVYKYDCAGKGMRGLTKENGQSVTASLVSVRVCLGGGSPSQPYGSHHPLADPKRNPAG